MLERHERAAAERLNPDAFEYVVTGGGEELSLRDASDAWRRFRLRPHVLRDVSSVRTDTEVLGLRLRAPILVAPMATHVLAHGEAELETARGVRRAQTSMVVATRASRRIEEIASRLSAPWWFQVYVVRDRTLTEALVRRAAAAGASALALTGDTPLLGRKPRQSFPPFTEDMLFANFGEHIDPAMEQGKRFRSIDQDPTITLDTIGWLHRVSGLPVLVKGVLRADDAAQCVEHGAAGIIVSNHGARQLDRSVASADALRDVAATVGDRVPVLVDGGIRSGVDVLIALALGARAVLIGRPVLWALATDGANGVASMLEALVDDLVHVMSLAGVTCIEEITPDLLA
ncbi:MAG: alpha-hydroxy-acid oxidizing protein [Candidatus Dormibacteraeota bacterium]|nr:alpha-hydroxy-acid oxidizing protein [Candidatus Dormibacteraeota bacterium]